MTVTHRHISLFAAVLFSAISLMAEVVYEPLVVDSGFNRDVIAEKCDTYHSPIEYAESYLLKSGSYYFFGTKSVIEEVNTSKGMSAENIAATKETGWPDDNGNPDDRIIRCTEDAKDEYAYPDVYFKLAPYDGKNALTLRPIGSNNKGFQDKGCLKLKKIGCYQRLFFLVVSTKEGSVSVDRIVNVVVHYTDGFVSDTTSFVCLGFKGKQGQRVCKTNTLESTSQFLKWSKGYEGTAWASVFDIELNTTKLVDRIEFINPIENTAETILAVTGITADMEVPNEEANEVSSISENSFAACWQAISEAASYRLDVAEDPDFQRILAEYNNKPITDTTCAEIEGLLKDHDYYWRVRSVNSEGGQSASSTPMRVRTDGDTPPATSETDTNIEEMLAAYAGYRGIVPSILIHRTLYRDGAFNTLCLPFNMTAEQIAASPITGASVYEYVRGEKLGESQLDIVVSPTDHIEAGVPYLVKWAPTTPEIIDEGELVFHNVNIITSTGQTIGGEDDIRFVGNIGIARMVVGDHDNLFLGAANTLYWPDFEEERLKGFRAYFQVPTSGAKSVARNTPARIVQQSQVATDINDIQIDNTKNKKILRSGQIFILRDGQFYNLLGNKITPKL